MKWCQIDGSCMDTFIIGVTGMLEVVLQICGIFKPYTLVKRFSAGIDRRFDTSDSPWSNDQDEIVPLR